MIILINLGVIYRYMVGDIAHVFNRGVDKRKVFLDEKDYLRFIMNLGHLNNKSGKLKPKRVGFNDILDQSVLDKREKLVEIFKWSLLPNHYHLLLYEKVDGGILEFTKRIGNAYTKYFNIKNNKRSGYLFQNSAKIVPIENNSQFLYIPIYIDLNSVDMFLPHWKENGLSNIKEAKTFMKNYNWSSFRTYFGDKKFDEIVNRDLFYETFGISPDSYEKDIVEFLSEPIVNLPG